MCLIYLYVLYVCRKKKIFTFISGIIFILGGEIYQTIQNTNTYIFIQSNMFYEIYCRPYMQIFLFNFRFFGTICGCLCMCVREERGRAVTSEYRISVGTTKMCRKGQNLSETDRFCVLGPLELVERGTYNRFI